MKRYLALIAAVALCGCQSKQISEMSYSETKELAAVIVKRCLKQGVKENSREMQLCTQQEVSRENAMRKNAMASRNVRVTAYCQNFGGNTVCF